MAITVGLVQGLRIDASIRIYMATTVRDLEVAVTSAADQAADSRIHPLRVKGDGVREGLNPR
jgi:hypothetical protein